VKVVILTPLSLEQDAARPYLLSPGFHLDGSNAYLTGGFEGRHQFYDIAVFETGPRNSAVALAAEKALSLFHPNIAILLGIAGGVKDVAIGDVAVGTKAYGYESGKQTTDGFVYRPDVYLSSQALVAQARLVAKSNDWKKRSEYAPNRNVTFGPAANAAAFVFEFLYQLDPKHLNLPLMNAKELAKAIYENINPAIQSEVNGASGQGAIWKKVRPLLAGELGELMDDPDDEDAQAAIRNKLKRVMTENETLKKELEDMLVQEKGDKAVGNSVHIEKSKNVVQGSTISVGGNFHLGDQTNIGKNYEVRDTAGNVYIADTINIEQAASTHGAPLDGKELNAVKMQVVQNKIKPALNTLLEHSAHDQDLNNQVVLLASRWNQLQKEKNMNIISKSHADIEYNRIRAALLDTIDEMDRGF
jgi:hypothetical protein